MKRALLMVFGAIVLFVLLGSTYSVRETEQVIITRFGKPIGDPVNTPGLHFKLPMVHTVNRFEKRFLEWDGEVKQLNTREKQPIKVDTYARWRITDPLKFFQRLRDERGAQSRLDDILDGETRNAIANHNLAELVRSTNREPQVDEERSGGGEDAENIAQPGETEQDGGLQSWELISVGREAIRREILAKAQARTSDLGIEILDIQFKRVNYVESVQKEVYQRMIAERNRIAARYLSEGRGEAARIEGQLALDQKSIESQAIREAEEIRGRADAEATEIYASAYNQSTDARSFYEFLKTMESFGTTIDGETTLVLSTDGEFYSFLKDSGR
jgi:membrane protease subunit HflC